jgi:hypothetical protein
LIHLWSTLTGQVALQSTAAQPAEFPFNVTRIQVQILKSTLQTAHVIGRGEDVRTQPPHGAARATLSHQLSNVAWRNGCGR